MPTEAYARPLLADIPDIDDATLDDRVQARVRRQDILDKAKPPTLHFVMSESGLRRMWAPDDVMREQIEHLVTLSEWPNVFTQVLPFDLPPGRRATIKNRFTLLRVPSPGAAGPLEVSYVENTGEIRYLDDKKALTAYEFAWTHLTDAALRFDESRAFMEKIMHEFM